MRELVKVNHLQNCLLCHPPIDQKKVAEVTFKGGEEKIRGGRGGMPQGLTAPVALPGQPLASPTPSGGYGHFSQPDTLLAFDATYLRQDFSTKLPVADARPWPDTQRFDFMVRTREVTEKEADEVRALLRQEQPYQDAARAALQRLRDK